MAKRLVKPKPVAKAPLPPTPVTTDLVQLAGQIPAEILQQLATAVEAGSWMVAVWRVADGKVHLDRTMINFPTGDLGMAVQLLGDNLKS